MKLYVRDITDKESQLVFSENEDWVLEAVQKNDEQEETLILPPHEKAPKTRPVSFTLKTSRVGEVFVLNGKAQAEVFLNCSRCVARFGFPALPKFTLLYSRNSAYISNRSNHVLKPENSEPLPTDGLDSEEDVDITHLTQDFIDLGEVLAEQLQLQVPFQPLCKGSCKGICQQCGANLNRGRCACSSIKKKTPFSSLKDFK